MIIRCTRCSSPYEVDDDGAIPPDFVCEICGEGQFAPSLGTGTPGSAARAVLLQVANEALLTVVIHTPVYGLQSEFPLPLHVTVMLDKAGETWTAHASPPDWISYGVDGIVGLDRVVREGVLLADEVACELFPFMNPRRYSAAR